MSKSIIIIGSGFGSLSCASFLAKQGHKVTVLEKNARLGGRAMTFDDKGYHFDMGPSWYLMPDVFEKFFAHFQRKVADYVSLKALDPMYRMFFNPQEKIDIVRDLQKNLNTFESLEKGAGTRLKEYLDIAEEQYTLAMDHFLYKQFNTIFDFLKPELAFAGRKAHVFQNLEKHIEKYTSDDRLKKILGYTMVFLGGAPHNTPALYSLMSHVDYNLGVFYPDGGFGALVDAFVKIAKEQGVEFMTSCEVKKILTRDRKIIGVKTDFGRIEADIVISNADYHHTEMKLLSPENRSFDTAYWEKRTLAPSAYIIHLGLNRPVEGLLHHNLILSHDWHKHFYDIFNNPSWPEKPSYYVCCPTKTDRSISPPNTEILFILVPVAAGLNDSDKLRNSYYEYIMNDLEKHIGRPIQDSIVSKRIYTHRDFKSDYNAYKGTALGLAHTIKQTAIMRPPTKSKKVAGLYYVGQFTQPGIGVPICVISGQLVSERISLDYEK